MKESTIFNNQNLTEKVHYVYRVTIDEKYYIGKRTGFLNDLITGRYRTSSKLVHEKLKNGHHFSKIKILQVFSTEKEALEYEKKYLTHVDARRNPKFLNQSNGGNGNYTCKKHTEKSKAKMSKSQKERFNPNTESGLLQLEENRRRGIECFNPETEEGRKRRENQSNKRKEYFNPETEEGRKNLEKQSEISLARFDKNTEEGIKRREKQSQSAKAQFDENTELGRQRREILSEKGVKRYNPNTEEGIKRREHHSEKTKAQFDINTEQGRKNREHLFNKRKEQTKEELQKRQNASILGELMFNEDFIKENFLITDDKNNLRFLWSVYSKLTGYSKSHIAKEKRIGKLSFLHGIKSISISKEQENAKIKEINFLKRNLITDNLSLLINIDKRSKMISKVSVQPIDKDKFRTTTQFFYKDITIPKGFVTNGANVPRIFWSLFPPNSPEYLSAVVVHDYMCANMEKFGWKKADQYLYDAMLDCGVKKWKAKTFYYFCYIRHEILKVFVGEEYKNK